PHPTLTLDIPLVDGDTDHVAQLGSDALLLFLDRAVGGGLGPVLGVDGHAGRGQYQPPRLGGLLRHGQVLTSRWWLATIIAHPLTGGKPPARIRTWPAKRNAGSSTATATKAGTCAASLMSCGPTSSKSPPH